MSHAEDQGGDRRDFLFYATAGTGAVVTGAAVWPLVNQMNPSADVKALSSIRVDVSAVEPGSQLTVKWLGKPVFIRRRTQEEIDAANTVEMGELIDDQARNANLPDTDDAADANRFLAPFSGDDADGDGAESSDDGEAETVLAGEWLVMIGVCTHLGCVPLGDGSGDFGGWFCPCHGSHYDTSGRIRRGPAPENLAVPVAAFVDESTIKLG